MPKTGGRVAGTPNKNTASVKAALHSVYEKKGGDTALLAWAKQNEDEFYKLWGRMLPTEVSGPDGGAIVITEIKRTLVRPGNKDS